MSLGWALPVADDAAGSTAHGTAIIYSGRNGRVLHHLVGPRCAAPSTTATCAAT